ncbi:MAG: GNAT family N-acetyltransferase [Candidatus Marinimicrobia bacterium]|nr:GNAT family N-acetyltransferase [Candidatus Neomarinimicrobiota bacterium]
MSISIKPYKNKYSETWDNFVRESVNGTIFHTRLFLSYHPKDRFRDGSLIFRKNDEIFALFPAARGIWDGKDTLCSHKGASYGGLIHREGLGVSNAFSIVESLINYFKKQNISRIIITLPPIIYNHRLSNYIDFALIKNGFKYLKREVSSIVFLENNIDQNIKKFMQTNRTAFRRAMKLGVEVRESDEWERFYEILKNNLKIRHNVQPTHTLEELIKLKKLLPDKIFLYGAYINDEMIAGVVMFDCNQDVSLAFYISHDESKQKYRGVNILFYHIINRCINNGFKYLDFGIFTVNMEPNFGLARFKEGFGSSGILRDTLVLDL